MLPCSRRSFQSSKVKNQLFETFFSFSMPILAFLDPYPHCCIQCSGFGIIESRSGYGSESSISSTKYRTCFYFRVLLWLLAWPLKRQLRGPWASYPLQVPFPPSKCPPPAPFLLLHSWAKFIYLIKSLGVVLFLLLIFLFSHWRPYDTSSMLFVGIVQVTVAEDFRTEFFPVFPPEPLIFTLHLELTYRCQRHRRVTAHSWQKIFRLQFKTDHGCQC